MPDIAPPKSPHPAPETTPHPEPRPFSVLHAYGWLRRHLGQVLGRGSRHKVARWAVWPLCALAAVLDLPLRWLATFLDTLIGNKGYLTVGSIAAVYLAVFGLIDNKSTQELTQAGVERGIFMTMVTAGNAPSFVAAMRTFGPVQTMEATAHPDLFRFWTWGQTAQPNLQPMHDWAMARLGACKPDECSLDGKTRLDLSGANLSGANLQNADLEDADLEDADLIDALLHFANLQHANLSGAFLNDAALGGATLTGAYYDNYTQFPDGFDPKTTGMIHVED